MRWMSLLVAVAVLVPAARRTPAQMPPPIIDMHMHAIEAPPMRLGLCLPWVTQFPAWERDRPWEDVFIEAMSKPPCEDPIWSAETPEANMTHTLGVMQRRNITGVVSGPIELLRPWTAAARERVIPSLQFRIGRDDVTPDDLRRLHAAGEIAVFGEIANQYGGIAPNDPRMDPYWAVAEELDIPVAIHMGDGSIGTPYLQFLNFPKYRAALSNPFLLEDVLTKYPRMRVSVMHYGTPMVDEMIAVMTSHPQVYIDIGGIQWYYPRPYFYQQLKQFMDAGLGKRVMFGSDQAEWPGVLEHSIEVIDSAPFLSESEKRDIFYENAARFLRIKR